MLYQFMVAKHKVQIRCKLQFGHQKNLVVAVVRSHIKRMPYKHGVTGSSPVVPTIRSTLEIAGNPWYHWDAKGFCLYEIGCRYRDALYYGTKGSFDRIKIYK